MPKKKAKKAKKTTKGDVYMTRFKSAGLIEDADGDRFTITKLGNDFIAFYAFLLEKYGDELVDRVRQQ